MSAFVILDGGAPNPMDAVMGEDGIWLATTDVAADLGWEVKPEGLCQDDVCIPLADRADLIDGDTINLRRLAELIARPLAVSVEDRVAYLGPPFDGYESTVGHLEAPDFKFPDLSGRMHSLSEHRGSKVLLAAWASW